MSHGKPKSHIVTSEEQGTDREQDSRPQSVQDEMDGILGDTHKWRQFELALGT